MIITAVMETSNGTINLSLFPDHVPVTVANFVNLANRNYFDGLNFHRVVANFMIQGGCPDGTGTGSPGYRFEDEFSDELRHDQAGKLSMANSGPGTNGSQFFITHVPTQHLDNAHTIFGEVNSGEDQAVVNRIERGDLMTSIRVSGDTESLLADQAEKISAWNKILDKKFSSRR